MDGLTFLARLMAEDPIPVVVCSSLAGPSTEAAFRALALGAVDVIAKPRLGIRDYLETTAHDLVEVIRGAARARVVARASPQEPSLAAVTTPPPSLRRTTDRVVAIGASTGGTEAIRQILAAMPPDGPATVVVQHMPAGFTAAFARRLDQCCQIAVKEAADGDRVLEGRALIAPGDRHLQVVRDGAHYAVRLDDGPLVSRHRPSVDVLFRSVARVAGSNAVGVILTGMGDDGADGLGELREAGAVTLAQDEASCVVFGMPKEAIARGAVTRVVPLAHLPATILRHLRDS
jgi:two-component system chemotaxis response regulator CheB